MAQNGISCTHAYAHSWNTQFSYPSIFTSSLPLDFGGYDRGILQRPVSIVEIFKQHGFKTVAFSSDYYLHNYSGYDRGFDEFYELSDITNFWRHIQRDYLNYYNGLRNNNMIGEEEFYHHVTSLLENVFRYMLTFCKRKQSEIDSGFLVPDPLMCRYDFSILYNLLATQLADLQSDPISYIDYRLAKFDVQGMSNSAELAFTKISQKVLDKLKDSFTNWTGKECFSSIQDYAAEAAMFGINLSRFRQYKFVDGRYINSYIQRWGQTKQGSFFSVVLPE